jgi:hypothetical protein
VAPKAIGPSDVGVHSAWLFSHRGMFEMFGHETPNSLDRAVDEYTLPFDYGHAVEA